MTQLEYDYMTRMPRELHDCSFQIHELTDAVRALTKQVAELTEKLNNNEKQD